MAIDVKRPHDLPSHYFLPTRTSLKRSRCYLADDVDTLVAGLRKQLDECQALIKKLPAQKNDWHSYKGCGDAPNVADYQKETYLCMVQRYAKETGEEIGAVSYQVLLGDDNGSFWGLKRDSLVDYKVIAWKEITGRDYEEVALDYQRQGTVK